MNEEIKKTLSEILRELKDPRVSPLASIMGVEVTNDLKHAKVKVSVYDKEQEPREQTVAALNKAEGFIAREVGRRMQIRALPKFKFLLDDSIEYSVHISGILRELHKDDPEETAPEE
jgi:ribosome-binding factor A